MDLQTPALGSTLWTPWGQGPARKASAQGGASSTAAIPGVGAQAAAAHGAGASLWTENWALDRGGGCTVGASATCHQVAGLRLCASTHQITKTKCTCGNPEVDQQVPGG